jgi:integrase
MANATPKLEKRKDKSGELITKKVPVLVDFTFDGKRMWVSTGEHCDVNKWDEKNNRVKASVTGSTEINEIIKAKCEEINKVYREAIIMGKQPTPSYLRNILNADKLTVKKSLFALFDEFIEGSRLSSSMATVKKLKTGRKHLQDFSQKYRLSVDFDTLDMPFFHKYVEYFQSHHKHLNATIAKNVKSLKTFLNWATKLGYNKNLMYKNFIVKDRAPEIITLTESEFWAIHDLDIKYDSLKQVRDVFCFCCLTSLRYSDVKNLKKSDIGDGFIKIISIKTQSQVSIPLISESKTILDRYSNTIFNAALPVLSNQKMNEHLKEIGKQAGLTRLITKVRYSGSRRIENVFPLHDLISTHMGRKTFITLMFRKGVESELIRAISNHKSIESFARYNNIDDDHKASAMSVAFKKAI